MKLVSQDTDRFIRIVLGDLTRCRNFEQNFFPQNSTRRGPQPVKIVFYIICGIGDFRAYVFFAPASKEQPRTMKQDRLIGLVMHCH